MTPDDKPFANPDVVLRDGFDDAALLFHPHLADVLAVTGAALHLWRCLDGRRSLAEVAEALAAHYDQAPEIILEDTLAFTQELYRRLFVLTEPPPEPTTPVERPRRFIIPPLAAAPERQTARCEAYGLMLANGMRIVLRALDATAAHVVASFAEAAQLQPAGPPTAVGSADIPVATRPCSAAGENFCLIDPPGVLRLQRRRSDGKREGTFEQEALDPEKWLWLQLMQLSACIGAYVRKCGGILLHSALAAYRDPIRDGTSAGLLRGVLITARSGVGKTTASNRLPAPWISLCDDMTLVIPDAAGAFWAHPMPTWSRFCQEGRVSRWDMQAAVPLRAVFLLRQAGDDRATPIGAAHAVGFLTDRANELTRYWREAMPQAKLGEFNLRVFDNLCRLGSVVPSYLLDATPDGAFWDEMERALFCPNPDPSDSTRC